MVLFTMLYKQLYLFQSADEFFKCNHLDENYWSALSCGAVRLTVSFPKLKLVVKIVHFATHIGND